MYNFSSGEISPRIRSRFDLPIYASGLGNCLNWVISSQGAAIKRPGTVLSGEVNASIGSPDGDKSALGNRDFVKMIPFRLSPNEQYVLELTHKKIRIHLFSKNRAYPMVSNTANYLHPVRFVPGRDYLRGRISSKKDATKVYVKVSLPRDLKSQEGELQFSISRRSYDSKPISIMSFKDKGQYVLNASFMNTDDELFVRLKSSGTYLDKSLLQGLSFVEHGIFVEIESPFSGEDVEEIKFYQNGENLYLVHSNYPPQRFSIGRDLGNIALSEVRFKKMPALWSSDHASYPSIVSMHEGRTVWSGVRNHPDVIWFSKVNNIYDIDTSARGADSAMEIHLNLRAGGTILWFVSDLDLYVGTDEGIYSVSSRDGMGLRVESIRATLKNSSPASDIHPIRMDDAIIYLGRDKRKLQRISHSSYGKRLLSEDISVFSEHMTESGITNLSISRYPENIIWMCRKDGILVGVTYDYNQKVLAWHRHEIGGSHLHRDSNGNTQVKNYGYVEDVLSIFCDGRDVLFISVRRGSFDKRSGTFREFRTIETLDFSKGMSKTKVAYTDCTLFFKLTLQKGSVEIGEVREVVLPQFYAYSDLHLNQNDSGSRVIPAERVYNNKKVSFLPVVQGKEVDKLYLGYEYKSFMDTLPLLESMDKVNDKVRPVSIKIHLYRTSYLKIGSSKDSLQIFDFKEPFTGFKTIQLDSKWNRDGKITFFSDKPLSGCILGVLMSGVFSNQGG